MNTQARTLPTRTRLASRATSVVAEYLISVRGAIVASLAAARRRAAHRREMHAMSDATLRDLGLQRSEIDSCWAESEGLAQPTRLRLLLGAWR